MEKIILWGACNRTKNILQSIDSNNYEVIAVIDNNKSLQGTKFEGIDVYDSSYIHKACFDKLILGLGRNSYNAVKKQLTAENFDLTKLEKSTYFIRNDMMDFYKNTNDAEIKKIMDYIKHNGLDVFNYEFTDKYDYMPVECCYDNEAMLWFVIENGKRMYMKASLDTRLKVEYYYRSIAMEQDPQSPHRYDVEGFHVEQGMTVIDAGVAEGNFALSVIDKVNKIFLVECDSEWIEALRYTFKDYKDKVVYVEKLLSDSISDTTITIDKIAENENIDYIKMDIEGYEVPALKGAENTLTKPIKLNICCYHNVYDEKNITGILQKNKIKTATSKGYMCYLSPGNNIDNEQKVYKLVRGLVRGISE